MKEVRKLRPCLAPDHDHLILCTKANRMCEAGRNVVRNMDPRYGTSAVTLKHGSFHPWSGVASYATA